MLPTTAESEFAVMSGLVRGNEDKLAEHELVDHCSYRELPLTEGKRPCCAVLFVMNSGRRTSCWNPAGTTGSCETAAAWKTWTPILLSFDVEGDLGIDS
jgi:hypothetical protein